MVAMVFATISSDQARMGRPPSLADRRVRDIVMASADEPAQGARSGTWEELAMHRKIALLAFVASALIAFGVGPAAAQKQTLKMAYWAGPSHHMVQTLEAWAKTVQEASGGNLTI